MPTPKLIGRLARETITGPRTTPGPRKLPGDLLRQASRRVEIMAFVAGGLWILAPALGHVALYFAEPVDPRWARFNVVDGIATSCLAISVALYAYLRTGKRDPAFVMDLALAYMVVMAFGIGVLWCGSASPSARRTGRRPPWRSRTRSSPRPEHLPVPIRRRPSAGRGRGAPGAARPAAAQRRAKAGAGQASGGSTGAPCGGGRAKASTPCRHGAHARAAAHQNSNRRCRRGSTCATRGFPSRPGSGPGAGHGPRARPPPVQEAPVPARAAPPPPRPVDPRPDIRNLIGPVCKRGRIAEPERSAAGLSGDDGGAAARLGAVLPTGARRPCTARRERLDVTDSNAEALVRGSYTCLNTSSQRNERQTVAFSATLRREGGRWDRIRHLERAVADLKLRDHVHRDRGPGRQRVTKPRVPSTASLSNSPPRYR